VSSKTHKLIEHTQNKCQWPQQCSFWIDLLGVCSFAALQMLYFRLVSVLFPTSDIRHPVVSPAMLFMSRILTQVCTLYW